MASNFEITISEKSDGFNLKLYGDFDVTSAYELIYAIRKLPENTSKIIININDLEKIDPFGVDVLNGFMNSLNSQSARFVLTGPNSNQLSLMNSWLTPKISKFFIKELSNPYV
jgi:stage II sporulation protein AA (anti-sigma F factor antagonist)